MLLRKDSLCLPDS
jgi:hypothetical protein